MTRTRLLLAAGGVLIAVQIVGPCPYLTPDAVDYLSMARSVADTGSPRRLGEEHLRLGPAYPFVLSPLFLLDPEPFLLLSVLNLALLAAFGLAAFAWARRVAPEAAPWVALFAVTNTVVLGLFRRSLSETVFCAGLFAVAVGYNRALAGALRPGWWAILLPLQCGVALTRQAGAFAAGGFAVALCWQALRGRRSWSSALGLGLLATVPTAAAVVGWTAFDTGRMHTPGDFHHASALATGPGPATADLPTEPLSRRLAEGLRVRVAEVGRVTIPAMAKNYAPPETWLHPTTLIYVLFFALIMIGWARHLRAADDSLAWMWPCYFALYVYWPFDQAARFTAPLAPLLAVCLWRAVGEFGGRRPALFAVLAALHLVYGTGVWLVTDRPLGHALWGYWPEVRRVADDFRERPVELAVAADAEGLRLAVEFLLDRDVPVVRDGAAPQFVLGWGDGRKGVPVGERGVVVRPP